MRKILTLSLLTLMLACNNSGKEKTEMTTEASTDGSATNESTSNSAAQTGTSVMKMNVDGKDITLNASALISKDDKNLQAGAPYFAMITGTDGPHAESLVLNFVFDTKAGSYPVVGVSFNRGSGDSAQVFGGLLGGEPRITNYRVRLTEVKDLGDNQLGGHKWSISGTYDDMTVPAMGIMLLDKSKKHPAEVAIKGGSFTNIVFDDNMDEVLKKAFDKMGKEN